MRNPGIGANCPMTEVAGGREVGDPAWASVLAQIALYDYQFSGDASLVNRSATGAPSELETRVLRCPGKHFSAALANLRRSYAGVVAFLNALEATRVPAGPMKGLVGAGGDGDYLNIACIAACYHCAAGYRREYTFCSSRCSVARC